MNNRVHSEIIGSLSEDYIVPTDHATDAIMDSHVTLNASVYQAGTKTDTVTGTWKLLSRNDKTNAFTQMNSSYWYGGKPSYSDDAHNQFGCLSFADYENATGHPSYRTVTDLTYPRSAQHNNYLFDHPDTFGGDLYATVIRWTPSDDYNCFNSDGNVYFTGEFLAGAYLKFSVIAYDESGTATTLLPPNLVSNKITTLSICAPQASYYDFIISPTTINSNANAIRILVSSDEAMVYRYDAAGTLQGKAMDLSGGITGAQSGESLVLATDITRGTAGAVANGMTLTIKSDSNAVRTISNYWDNQRFLTATGSTLNLENVRFDGTGAQVSDKGGVFYSEGPITINGSNAIFSNNTIKASNGAVICAFGTDSNVIITGQNEFRGNQAISTGDVIGGAIYSGGTISISGRNVFAENLGYASSGGRMHGGVMCQPVWKELAITGINRFENNGLEREAGKSGETLGGVLLSYGSVTISGQNEFVGNYVNSGGSTVGGVIYTNEGATISGQTAFIDNWTTGNGGAMRFNGGRVTFKGNGSSMRFENNQVSTGSTAVLNDIYFNGTSAVVC